MQCALTSSAATQRVQARRSGRQSLRVQATAQTTTGLPKPKWAGAAGQSGRAPRRRQLLLRLAPHPAAAAPSWDRHIQLRIQCRSTAAGLTHAAIRPSSQPAMGMQTLRARLPLQGSNPMASSSRLLLPAGDDLLSRLVNVVINSPLFDLLREGARARIKVGACRRLV